MEQDCFNNCRILEPIGNIPPAEYELMYYQRIEESSEAAPDPGLSPVASAVKQQGQV
jgi:hypothetical protein